MVFSISLFYCVIKKLVHLVISNCIHAKIILLCINFLENSLRPQEFELLFLRSFNFAALIHKKLLQQFFIYKNVKPANYKVPK